jgi:hypothetical protein
LFDIVERILDLETVFVSPRREKTEIFRSCRGKEATLEGRTKKRKQKIRRKYNS